VSATPFATAPPEEAALFNPAFIGLLIAVAATDYRATSDAPMPLALAFLVPPLALHADTRDALPANVRRRMSAWLVGQPVIRAGFPDRASATAPLVKEGLRYAVRSGAIELSNAGIQSRLKTTAGEELETEDARSCAKAAAFVGRWFGRTGDTATIFILWGARP
jgi:hypothetical protein